MRWDMEWAHALAVEHLQHNQPRWSHSLAVGELAQQLLGRGLIEEVVASAAWLHDVGYSPGLIDTGFHAIDGAKFLTSEGAPSELVGLVAHHTGAAAEAAERGLRWALAALPVPNAANLRALTLMDLSAGPDGGLMSPAARLAEILVRYNRESPVFRAVSKAAPDLLRAAGAARVDLGLTDEWPLLVTESVVKAQAH